MMCPKVEKPELLNGAVYVMNEFHLISGIITHDYLIIDSWLLLVIGILIPYILLNSTYHSSVEWLPTELIAHCCLFNFFITK